MFRGKLRRKNDPENGQINDSDGWKSEKVGGSLFEGLSWIRTKEWMFKENFTRTAHLFDPLVFFTFLSFRDSRHKPEIY